MSLYRISLSVFLLGILIGIVMEVFGLLLPVMVFRSAIVIAVLTVWVLVFIRWRWNIHSKKRLHQAVASVKEYVREFEALLSLVNQTTRLIRETEIISHGFSRPSHAVPITKVEAQGSSAYNCPLLRRKLFAVCQDGVRSLRRATCQLCTKFTSREEFDSRGSYLAFQQLETLHQFMRDGGKSSNNFPPGEKEEEERDGGPPLAHTLESLKDASNLLAVQNSELLRRLAIIACFTDVVDVKDGGYSRLMSMTNCLGPPSLFVHQASSDLQWSMDYHKNCLFGEPPTRERGNKDTFSDAHDLLDPLASDVHCMDLKAQITLQRIRDLGLWIASRCSEKEESVSMATDVLEPLCQRLSTVEQGIHWLEEHMTECQRVIGRLSVTQAECSGEPCSSQKEEAIDVTENEEVPQLLTEEGGEQECSDEEVVFEAYVSTTDVKDIEEGLDLCDEDTKKESMENSLRMMKELNSVLAVRSVKKKQKRELKQREKLGSQPLQENNPSLPNNLAELQTLPTPPVAAQRVEKPGMTDREERTVFPPSMEGQAAEKLDSEQAQEKDTGSDSHPPPVASTKQQPIHYPPPTSAMIAKAVAAAALKTGRTGNEELFYDYDLCIDDEKQE